MEKIEKDIQNYLNKIDSKLKMTTSKNLVSLLMVDLHKIFELIELYELNVSVPNSIIDRYDRCSYFLSVYNDIYKENYCYMYDYNEKVASLYSFFSNYYRESFFEKFEVMLNDSEIISYAKDFFSYYDKDIYKYFLSLLDNDRVYINMKHSDIQDADGYSVSILSNRDGFVFVNGDKTIEIVSTLIHEVAHSYVESFDYDVNYDEFCNQDINNLHDVYPFFMELVFVKYLDEIKFNYSDVRSLATGNYAANIMRLGYFDDLVNLEKIDELFNDKELILDFIDNENYCYSFIISEYFYDKYLKNPSHTKDSVLNFVLDVKKYNKKDLLNNNFYNMDTLLNKKKLIKNMKKYYGY